MLQKQALQSKFIDGYIAKKNRPRGPAPHYTPHTTCSHKSLRAPFHTKLIAQLEDLVSVRDAHQQNYNKQRAKLENLKRFGGSEEDIKKTKKEVKQQSEALESTKDSILDRVDKMRTMYINFIGDLHGTFTDTVETTLLKPTTHEITSYELKKVAFQWDNTVTGL